MFLLLIAILPLQASAQEEDIDRIDDILIFIDEQPLQLKEPIYIKDGRLFIPIRSMIEGFGGTINWNADDQQIFFTTYLDDTLKLTVDEFEMVFNEHKYIMDVQPFTIEGRMYIPLRHVAEFLHTDVTWDPTTLTASFTKVPLFTIKEGDTVTSLSKELQISESLLFERNESMNLDWQPGDLLKVVIPNIMEHKLVAPKESIPLSIESNPDYMLLAKIIQVEAGHESYEAQLAVGSVIMNRVKDKRFPNTIHDVIYAKGQFPPAHNGLLDKSKPNSSVLRAAEAVLSGVNNVEGAIYFYNPNVTKGKFWSSLTLVKKIGNHRFVK